MAKIALIFMVVLMSCAAANKTPAVVTEDLENPSAFKDSVPVCIRAKIDSFKIAAQHEQPQRVTQYEYKGKKVYYVTMHCCDFFNELYDEQCNLLGHPDGGFTGKGDGKLPDFNTTKTKEKIIWQVKQ